MLLYNMLCSSPGPALPSVPECPLGRRPEDARAQTLAASVPSFSSAPSQAPEERDVDWEDYSYEREPAAGGAIQWWPLVGAKLRTSWRRYWLP